MKTKNTFLILAALTSASVLAQPSNERASSASMPEAKTENGITYVCGGVGDNMADRMKRAASDFDLMMTFAASNGAYLADVDVDVADARGTSLLNVNCDGPIMLVDFPEGGKYRVRAESNGHELVRTARVKEGGKVETVAMAWPVSKVDMGLTPTMPPGSQSSGDSATEGMSSGGGNSDSAEGSTR